MLRKAGFLACIFLLTSHSLIAPLFAADEKDEQKDIPLFGHNLDSTSDTLHSGQWIVGDYMAGYGLNDHLMVLMSPWLSLNYNMTSFGLKYGFSPGVLFDRVSIEAYYFQTFQFLEDWYHQKSEFSRLTLTKRFSDTYRLHSSLGFQYFWDDLAPFSLRPPPVDGTPVTLSAGLLHEVHVTPVWGFFLETGVLAFNYPNRYLQLGASGFYEKPWGFIQLGASCSVPFGSTRLTGSPSNVWVNGSGQIGESVYYEREIPIHPEIQIEFFL